MADINVITEEVRNFARAGTGHNDELLRGYLHPVTCTSQLDGCLQFIQADSDAMQGLMEAVTRAGQLLNGVRHSADKIAGLYDDADANVADVMRRVHLDSKEVVHQEPNLPGVDQGLLDARRAGDTASRLDPVT
jgi:hypothetical protein